jgi:branched-chain amino acid transport system ATP-binding protein
MFHHTASQIVISKNLKALLGLAVRHYVMGKGRTVWQGN